VLLLDQGQLSLDPIEFQFDFSQWPLLSADVTELTGPECSNPVFKGSFWECELA